MIMICIHLLFTLIYLTNQFKRTAAGPLVFPSLTLVANYVSGYNIFYQGYVVTSIISFILTWIATVPLLHSYSKRIGRAKYWILVSIPLVYFLSQFQFVFVDMFSSLSSIWTRCSIIFWFGFFSSFRRYLFLRNICSTRLYIT